tara:strand:- start:877 stop:1107 length:231 start_codon:yes stop_codon:yes gene_type:complete
MSFLYFAVLLICIGLYFTAIFITPQVRIFVHGVEFKYNRYLWYEYTEWKQADFTSPVDIMSGDEMIIIYKEADEAC